MKLIGKAKEDFEKWYVEHIHTDSYNKDWYFDIDYFSPSMQYGVYVDWFDSCGINCSITPYLANGGRRFTSNSWGNFNLDSASIHKTRQEARAKAIEKATEIYNNK